MINLLRVLSVVLVLAAVALAMVPLVVIFDLAGGGDGLGLCPGGLARCRNPYTAAPELALSLTVGLFLVLGGLRLTQRALRGIRRRRREG